MAQWLPVMTDAGRAATQAANGLGLSAEIAAVALGTGKYAVRGADGLATSGALAATGLVAERLRVAVHAGGNPERGAVLIVSQVPKAVSQAEEFWITEVGFFDKNGVLLVIWSHTSDSLGFRGQLSDWNLQLGWKWRDLPSDAITVQVANAPLSTTLVKVAQLEAAQRQLALDAGMQYDPLNASNLTQALQKQVSLYLASVNKPIRKPVSVTPADGAVGVVLAPLLQGSPYSSPDGYVHDKSQFVVVNALGAVVRDSGEIAASTSWQVPTGALSVVTGYRWRVRYRGYLGATQVWSDWSADSAFITASTIVIAPALLAPASGAINVGPQPTLTTAAFAVSGGSDTHYRTRWQISTSTSFASLTWDSGDVTSLTQIVVPSGTLAAGTLYYVRARHIGAVLGNSTWSDPVYFTTKASFVYVEPPAVVAPANGSLNVSLTPTIALSAFAVVGATDTHAMTQIQMRLATGDWGSPLYDTGEIAATTSFTIPLANALPQDRDCVVRARYKGTGNGWSGWSSEISFRTTVPSGSQLYDVPGVYDFTVPAGVYSLSGAGISGGGGGGGANGAEPRPGGAGGALGWFNNLPVTPGQVLRLVVGAGGAGGGLAQDGSNGGTTSIGTVLSLTGGEGGRLGASVAVGGVRVGGDGGGDGGKGAVYGYMGTGGGAGGYNGKGGDGATTHNTAGQPGQGGAGGGGANGNTVGGWVGSGGGVGIAGQGADGAGGTVPGSDANGSVAAGRAGSNGQDGGASKTNGAGGGRYGGGGAAANGVNNWTGGTGGNGAIRLIWGPGRSYPFNAA